MAVGVALCPADPSPLTVVINEIHYDPFDKTSPSEFIELYNSGTGTVDLSGCCFSAGVDFTFESSTELASDAYLVVAQDSNEFARVFGFAPAGQWLTGNKLQNDGETVRLRDANGDEIDEVDYGLGFPWPTATQGDGPSMELINPAIDNDLGGAWRSSSSGPTPGVRNSVYATSVPPRIRQVDHGKDVKVNWETVTVTAKITDPDGVSGVDLLYQVVEPGDYINLNDPRYAADWTAIAMHDDGLNGDEAAGDDRYSVVLPDSLQQHRRLIRYRITAEDGGGATVTVPYADDQQPNFAYFVYDTMPAWVGSAQPGAGPEVTYGTNLLQSISVCHLLTVRQDRLNALYVPYRWGQADQQVPTTGKYNGMDYRWQGALVYDGRVYDHIRYRARGGVWRYAMGKNMWKFDFNRGRYLQAEDDYGRKYDTRWDKLNLSALIQQGNFRQRGEQGLFEAAGFRLHNLAGNPASKTHFLHFRVIEGEDENGPDQFSGDFQGLYLVIEQLDGQFLDEHKLPDGNLYKMEGGSGTLNNQGPTHPSDKSDLNAFQTGYTSSPDTAWWRANLDLDDYYSFRAASMAIHDYDMHAGKNYFYYHHPGNGLWQVLNWDLDLCWTTTYNGGGGRGPLYGGRPVTYLLNNPTLRIEYNNRVREIRDLLFNPEQTGMLLDEVARVVYTPGEPSLVDADRAMWDYNPILISSYINSSKASHGRYYEAVPTRDFAGMIDHVKNYVAGRMNSIDPKIASDDGLAPDAPTIAYTGDTNYPVNRLTFETSAFSGGSGIFEGLAWRIAEVTIPGTPEFDPSEPRKYEITASWESGEISTFAPTVAIPSADLRVNRRYRVRARMKDSGQRWSSWSDPAEFVTGPPDNEQALLDYLRITEVMYDPRAGSLYEYVEVCNTSTGITLDIAGVTFTDGIDFSFPQGAVLAPGAYAAVVRAEAGGELDQFRNHYGLTNGESIFGHYADKLSNGGESVRLKTAWAGQVVAEFEYGDGRGWPPPADGAGHSLVPLVLDDQTTGSLDYGGNWRASAFMGGSPAASNPAPVLSVVINELAAHTDTALPPPNDSDDWIELYNPLAVEVSLDGWSLSDDADELTKYEFPSNATIAAGGFLYVSETTHFHTNRTDGSGFGLDKAGESIFLTCLSGDGCDRIADAVLFEGQENGMSWGRYPDAGADWYALARTPDAPNALPAAGVITSEVMYNAPGDGDNNHAQFVELYNAGGVDMPLWNGAGGWRLSGIDYAFPGSVVITSGTYLAIVDFNPDVDVAARDEFLARYGLAGHDLRLVGPFAGGISDGGERLALERPQAPDLPGDPVSWVIVDEVIYSDRDPWETTADGGGASLGRALAGGSGNDPSNWRAASVPSPGEGGRAIGISFPAHGATYHVPVSTQASAVVDSGMIPGVSRVDFAFDGAVFHSTDNDPYSVPLALPPAEGTYALTAVLTDTGGGVHTSRTHVIAVYGPPPNIGINKLDVTFAGYSGSETLLGFPALVRLGTHLEGFAYSQFASADGYDLRFTDAAGKQSLAYEIEEWNTNGVSAVWVRVPVLPAGGTNVCAFWGVPGLASPPSYTTDGSTWSQGYAAVWHMSGASADSVGGAILTDHSSGAVAGVAGGARGLDGASAYLEPAVNAAWYNGNQGALTISLWASSSLRHQGTLFGAASAGGNLSICSELAGRHTMWRYHLPGAFDAFLLRQLGGWDCLAMTLGGGQATPYFNGSELTAAQAVDSLALSAPPLLGALNSSGPTEFFSGEVDELRLSTVVRSADWLSAEYRTIAEHNAFTTYRFLSTYATDTDGDSLPDRWEIEEFGATNAANAGAGEDWDGDGFSNYGELVAGSGARDGTDYFSVTVARSNDACVVGYRTAMPGAELNGRQRVYALQVSTNLSLPSWEYVVAHTNRPPTGGWNAYTSPVLERAFFRGEVRLK